WWLMQVTDLDFRHLVGKAGSVEQDECEGANQKAEQIKPPHAISGHCRSRSNHACRSFRLSFQATLSIVLRKESRIGFRDASCSGYVGVDSWRMPHDQMAR